MRISECAFYKIAVNRLLHMRPNRRRPKAPCAKALFTADVSRALNLFWRTRRHWSRSDFEASVVVFVDGKFLRIIAECPAGDLRRPVCVLFLRPHFGQLAVLADQVRLVAFAAFAESRFARALVVLTK
jgi:hypothetical protein